jgi:hypothetical protein
MGEDTFNRRLLWKILPRLFNAAVGGFLIGGPAFLIYYLPGYAESMEAFFPASGSYFSGLMAMYILFEIAIQLLAGTVFVYALGITRALMTMIILIYTTKGGIISQAIPFGLTVIKVTIEFRPILAMSLLLSLLVMFKNIMKAVDFLAEKSEEPVIPQELP